VPILLHVAWFSVLSYAGKFPVQALSDKIVTTANDLVWTRRHFVFNGFCAPCTSAWDTSKIFIFTLIRHYHHHRHHRSSSKFKSKWFASTIKTKYNTIQLTHRTVEVLIGQVIEESCFLHDLNLPIIISLFEITRTYKIEKYI